MKSANWSTGVSRTSGCSLNTIFPSRSFVGSFAIIVPQLKRNRDQTPDQTDYSRIQSPRPIRSKALARVIVPGIAQKLKRTKCDGSPAKMIDPPSKAAMAINVLKHLQMQQR